MYEEFTRCVQVMPLEEEGVPLTEIYGSVLIEQDLSPVKKTRRQNERQGRKPLDRVRDVLFVKDELARRVILTGEAGHGKTVFSLKLIDSWSKSKRLGRKTDGKQIDGAVKTKISDKLNKGTHRDCSEQVVGKRGGGIGEHKSALQHRQSLVDTIQKKSEDRELQECLYLYDLAFYVPLRHAKHGTSSIVDLVCGSMSGSDQATKQKIGQMLGDSNIKCLVILDGLDEYKVPDTCRVQGFPDSDGLVNCTLLCTMRPWKMARLQLGLDGTCDKVVRIDGLQHNSVKTVIKNVLINFYGLKVNSITFKNKFRQFHAKSKLPGMEDLLKVPLMLTSSCLVWNEEVEIDGDQGDLDSERNGDQGDLDSERNGDQGDLDSERDSDQDDSDSDDSSSIGCGVDSLSYFMTLFYLKLMEILITRAKPKHDIVKYFLLEKLNDGNTTRYIPHILSKFSHITDFLEVIIPIGRLALQDLVSDQTCLVFPVDKLERDIGHSNVELALKAGILSQTKAPGLSYQQRISVSFYHKSIQEFIAALYITCGDTEALASFRTHCNTVEKVMELSEMIMFMCGLDPVVGCQLSEHIKDVVNSDTDIIQYREKQEYEFKIGVLYERQRKWYSEMKQNPSFTHNTDRTPTIHVTDVCLDHEMVYVNVIDVCVASELVSMEDNSIMSVYLWVPHPVHSIIQHLPGCTHLTALYIRNIPDTQDRELLAEVLPQLVHLQYVVYGPDGRCPPADTAVVRAVQQLPALRRIELDYITLTDTVTLSSHVETVKLHIVKPSHFILPSVCQCSRLTCIELKFITLTDAVILSPQLQEVKLDDVDNAYYILQSLPGCPQLTSLDIANLDTMEDCEMLFSVLPQLPSLQYIHYNGEPECGSAGHAAVVGALQHLTQLTHIKLEDIDLGDDGTVLVTPHMTQLQKVELDFVEMSARRWTEFLSSLQHVPQLTHIKLSSSIDLGDACTLLLTPHMTQLQKVKLKHVKMSPRRWRELVSSLLSVQHTVHVTLKYTDIDGDTVNIIHYSPHCTVVEESDKPGDECYTLQFITFTSGRSNRWHSDNILVLTDIKGGLGI